MIITLLLIYLSGSIMAVREFYKLHKDNNWKVDAMDHDTEMALAGMILFSWFGYFSVNATRNL